MVDSEEGDRDISIFQPAEMKKDIKGHFHYEVKMGTAAEDTRFRMRLPRVVRLSFIFHDASTEGRVQYKRSRAAYGEPHPGL